MQQNKPALFLQKVSKSYLTPQGKLQVLQPLSLTLNPGQSLALMGESGSGKSTLLHLVAGLELADEGQILIAGEDITRLDEKHKAQLRRERLGLVFQQFNLVPSLKVKDNLAFQARLAGCLDKKWLDEINQRLGLEELQERYPEQLSGGQQQRVALGRALAHRPQLLLADEPTGSLDEATSDQVMQLLLQLVQLSGCSLLMVTHSLRLAKQLDSAWQLHSGQLEPLTA
ncbi:putative ABC transport system ATP-binding protein [Marinospirillum celere]|uniref:Putative ABC transport system ATP-binding protein n=1 Tax=Marinospirillum celere TaxID=1122252 RepID=A0A1I1E793_9GAMM|nr:ABC transporter ATP-binding protein [Marinospirillum celere]SFB82556.1 putative ABC transport system ATP-binding protein [Marinospirillum celere]